MTVSALSQLAFRLIGPDAPLGADGHLHLRRADGSVATLIETVSCRLESAIVDFGPDDARLRQLLLPLLPIRRMSRMANAAVLNLAVSEMPQEQAFVNVGVWNGFTFLAAMAGNEGKACIGVDNFSEFGGPKEDFLERFVARRSASHRFHDQDYVDFFAAGLDRPLGVYLYDGEHSYENQYRGLMVADPFYADDAVVVVDDTNLDRAREATLQFARDSRLDWHVVLDRRTSSVRHPTFWNGLMVLQAGAAGEAELEWPVLESLEDRVEPAGEEGASGVAVLALGEDDFSELEARGHEVARVSRDGLAEALLASRRRFVLIVESGSAPSLGEVVQGAQAALKDAARHVERAEAP